mmetsp:Transcript_29220/g.73423  ORF Transcript_29220/g.73423 Transcript_29220/m.73423 type:complete len:139 (-) Transcript_29220:65-481(-)
MSRLRERLGGAFLHRDVPLPLSYRQLVTFAVRGYLLLVLLGSGAVIVQEEFSNQAYWTVLTYAMEYFLFGSWLTIADALCNPFRLWSDAFDWPAMVKGTMKRCRELVEIADKSTAGEPEVEKDAIEAEKKNTTLKGWP